MSEPTTEAPTMRALAARVHHKILEQLALHEGAVRRKAIVGSLPELMELSEWDLEEVGKSSKPRWQNAAWYTTDAVKAGFMVKSGRGLWAWPLSDAPSTTPVSTRAGQGHQGLVPG